MSEMESNSKELPQPARDEFPRPRCPHCGGKLEFNLSVAKMANDLVVEIFFCAHSDCGKAISIRGLGFDPPRDPAEPEDCGTPSALIPGATTTAP